MGDSVGEVVGVEVVGVTVGDVVGARVNVVVCVVVADVVWVVVSQRLDPSGHSPVTLSTKGKQNKFESN